jgi:orotate phosphoribosyltransferase
MYNDVCHTLGAVGKSLLTRPREPRVLRLAADRLPALSQFIGDKDLVLLSSYLKLLTDDIWFNIMADNSAKISIEQRDSLMVSMGHTLIDLSTTLQRKRIDLGKTKKAEEIAKIYTCYIRLGAIWNKVPNLQRGSFQTGIPKTGDDLTAKADKQSLINCENVLSSGFKSNWNYDIDARLCRVEDIDRLSKQYVRKIKDMRKMGIRIDKLAFIDKDYGPLGTIALMSSIAEGTKIDCLIVRLRRRVPIGQIKCEKIESNDCVLIVSDVLTTGDGILKTTEILRKSATVTHALVYLDREQGGRKRLKDVDIVVETIKKPSHLGMKKPEPLPVGGDELFQLDSQ